MEVASALLGTREPKGDKIVKIMVEMFDTIVGLQNPTEGLGKAIEYVWCRSEAKWQYFVKVVLTIPPHAEVRPVFRPYGTNPKCWLNVYFFH